MRTIGVMAVADLFGVICTAAQDVHRAVTGRLCWSGTHSKAKTTEQGKMMRKVSKLSEASGHKKIGSVSNSCPMSPTDVIWITSLMQVS